MILSGGGRKGWRAGGAQETKEWGGKRRVERRKKERKMCVECVQILIRCGLGFGCGTYESFILFWWDLQRRSKGDYFFVPWDVCFWMRESESERGTITEGVTNVWDVMLFTPAVQWMKVTLTMFGGSTSIMLDIIVACVFMDRYMKKQLSLNDIWTNELLLSWSLSWVEVKYGHHWDMNWM